VSAAIDDHQQTGPEPDRDALMRKVLEARARRLSQTPSETPLASEFVEVLTFSVGRDRFAIETRSVTEVLRDVQVTPLPGDTKPLMGLTNLRGDVLAVMSLAGVLPLGKDIHAGDAGRWVIVLGDDQATFGIAVSDVTEVVSYPLDSILPSATATTVNPGLLRGVTGDARVVLDGHALLEDARFVIDQE